MAARGGRQQINGAQQGGAGGTGVVKSLLTGRQYGQSVLRPDIGRGGAQGKATPVKTTTPKQQVSLLQPNWQQQQQTVDASAISAETQQLVLSGLPDNIGPGESLYVVVDGVTYQIDSSNAELLAAAAGGGAGVPLGSRISLEDLANISAEQQTLSLDYQTAAGEMGVSAGDIKMEMHAGDTALGIDGQQFLEGQTGVVTSGSGHGTEPMQIIILPADGSDVKSADFKVGNQDFILQPGQQLPPELQDMVARGLPIDFSNYEFVIQEEGGSVAAAQAGAGTTYLTSTGQQIGGDGGNVMVSLAGTGGSNEDILGMLADASSQQGGLKIDMSHWATAGTSTIPIFEEDDGEFTYVMPTEEEAADAAASGVPRPIMESKFLAAFTDFLSGAKAETLSSVANSTVIRKQPQLPIAYVPEPNRKSAGAAHGDKKTPMTVVYSEGAGSQVIYVNESGTPRGRGRARGRPPTNQIVVQKFPGGRGGATPQQPGGAATATPGAREQFRQSIIAKSELNLHFSSEK